MMECFTSGCALRQLHRDYTYCVCDGPVITHIKPTLRAPTRATRTRSWREIFSFRQLKWTNSQPKHRQASVCCQPLRLNQHSPSTQTAHSLYTGVYLHTRKSTQITTGAVTMRAALRPSAGTTHGRSVAIITFITFIAPATRCHAN